MAIFSAMLSASSSSTPRYLTLDRLKQVGIAATFHATGALMWRGVLLGTALYLLICEHPEVNLKLNGASYIVAIVWAYHDGMLARRIWSMAFVQAIVLQLLGVQVGNLLAAIFGIPLLGTCPAAAQRAT